MYLSRVFIQEEVTFKRFFSLKLTKKIIILTLKQLKLYFLMNTPPNPRIGDNSPTLS